MTYIGEPEKEIESTPMVEPVPEIIELPQTEPAHAPAIPVPSPVPVETKSNIVPAGKRRRS